MSKRDQLVQKALETFDAGGFHAVGMDRLAAETGVSKTSIYKHFRTKEDLILAVLRLRDEQFRNWFLRRLTAIGGTPRDQLLAVFDVLAEWVCAPEFASCTFIKASSEYGERAHPIHAMAATHKQLMQSALAGLAKEAGALNPEHLARQLDLLIQGAIVLAHLHDPKERVMDAKKAARAVIAAALDGQA